MADSKLYSSDSESDDDMVHCGICFAIIDKPKALPCLHTFCYKCLSSWSESSARKQPDKYAYVVSCPSCREESVLPEGGVKNLKTNFFVTKLKERKSIQRRLRAKNTKIQCTSCTDGSAQNVAVGRCVDCDDFLCDRCVTVHKSVKVLRQHQLLTLDELRSGKLAIRNIPEQELCPKHPREILQFYCETCDEPMCRDCTVVDHPRPDHIQVELKTAARERSANLVKLAEECHTLVTKADNAIETDEKNMRDLEAALDRASISIKESTRAAVTSVTKALESSGAARENELQQIGAKRRKDIECHKESLELLRIRTRTALQMTHQVTQKGSDNDVATMYSSLTNTMTELLNVNPTAIRKSIAKLEFRPNEYVVKTLGGIGTLQTYGQWVLDTSFDNLRAASHVIFNMAREIAVTDRATNSVVVFATDGGRVQLQLITPEEGGRIQRRCSQPWGLALGRDGRYFVSDIRPCVNVFDAHGDFTHRFEKSIDTFVQDSYKSNEVRARRASPRARETSGFKGFTQLRHRIVGLTVDSRGLVFVGIWSKKPSVSIHNQDGSRVSSFDVRIMPYFIAVSPWKHVFISDMKNNVHVYDISGNHLHTFATPEGAPTWQPTGICLTQDNEEVYVASQLSPAAIYRYTVTGQYLGVCTMDRRMPLGISISQDGDTLAVADNDNVRLFKLE